MSKPIWTAALLVLIVVVPTTARAEWAFSAEAVLNQLLKVWLPLAVLMGLWLWILRRGGFQRQREYMERGFAHMERGFAHMDALEHKLDRIIALLEEGGRSDR